MPRFKILTYNIHGGRSAIRGRDICHEVARVLDFSEVDTFCLQEVWQHEGFEKHQLERHLCDQRWPHRLFEITAANRAGRQGNAIVSRAPIRAWTAYDVSFGLREPRSLLHALVDVGDGTQAAVFCVHFGLLRRERRHQTQLLREFVAAHVPPKMALFIAGDFNDWRQELAEELTGELGLEDVSVALTGSAGKSYPAYWPWLSLDRIYYRNARPLSVRIVRPRKGLRLSDHLPLEAQFEISACAQIGL